MTEIKNETGTDAVICFGEKVLEMVCPEEFEVLPGQPVEWRIVPPNEVTVKFDANDSPVEWSKLSSKDPNTGVVGPIKGTIKRDAQGIYKYSVTDTMGNTIDPRVKVRR